MVAQAYHRYNLSTREPEAGGCEFEAILGYTGRHDLIKLTKKKKKRKWFPPP